MDRHSFLREIHRLLQPRTYLEIGVSRGVSLKYSRTRTIGIDPAFRIDQELRCDLALYRTTTDEFFARPNPLEHFAAPVIDYAFIDGMHLAEYALRDFINVERYTLPCSAVVFDDMLPRTVVEANRRRTQTTWAGDVYKVIGTLRRRRPDLLVFEVDTTPTGTLLVLAPDAADTALLEHYDEEAEAMVSPDPQPVPEAILRRAHAVDPALLLAPDLWDGLRDLRASGGGTAGDVRRLAASCGIPGIATPSAV